MRVSASSAETNCGVIHSAFPQGVGPHAGANPTVIGHAFPCIEHMGVTCLCGCEL